MFCFLLVYAYGRPDDIGRFPLSVHHMLLLLFGAYACFSRKRRLFTLFALFLAATLLEQSTLHTSEGIKIQEVREYLLSIACVVYAGELYLTHRAVAEKNVRAAPSQR